MLTVQRLSRYRHLSRGLDVNLLEFFTLCNCFLKESILGKDGAVRKWDPPTQALRALPGCDLTACSSVYLVLGKSKITNEMAVCSSPILIHIISVASKQITARDMLLTMCACDSKHCRDPQEAVAEVQMSQEQKDVGSVAENCGGSIFNPYLNTFLSVIIVTLRWRGKCSESCADLLHVYSQSYLIKRLKEESDTSLGSIVWLCLEHKIKPPPTIDFYVAGCELVIFTE